MPRVRQKKGVTIAATSEPQFDQLTVCQALGIRSETTLGRIKSTLDIVDDWFRLADAIEALKLKLFLGAEPGVNSYETYRKVRKHPSLLALKFQQWGIDLDTHINNLKQKLGAAS